VDGVTAAVRVTVCPLNDGLTLELSEVVVVATVAFTVWVRTGEVLVLCVELPL